jgi:hypothetical protein
VVSRSTVSDFSGSGTALVSMKSHFGHSKVRFSDPSGKDSVPVNVIRIPHRPQRGRSIEVSMTA